MTNNEVFKLIQSVAVQTKLFSFSPFTAVFPPAHISLKLWFHLGSHHPFLIGHAKRQSDTYIHTHTFAFVDIWCVVLMLKLSDPAYETLCRAQVYLLCSSISATWSLVPTKAFIKRKVTSSLVNVIKHDFSIRLFLLLLHVVSLTVQLVYADLLHNLV